MAREKSFSPLWPILALFMVLAIPAAAQGEKPTQPAQPAPIPDHVIDALKNQSSGDAARAGFHERNPRYRISRGDVLAVAFTYTPEFNRTVAVQPDGFVTLGDVGDIHVAGKTVTEAAAEIREAYGKILREPVITVDLKDFEKPYFVVLGMVGQPGKYELRGDTTVAQAVAVSGGFTEKAKHSQVMLFRRVSSDTVEARQLNLKKMLNAKNLSEDMYLRPGDIVYVPQNTISKIQRFIPIPSMAYRPF